MKAKGILISHKACVGIQARIMGGINETNTENHKVDAQMLKPTKAMQEHTHSNEQCLLQYFSNTPPLPCPRTCTIIKHHTTTDSPRCDKHTSLPVGILATHKLDTLIIAQGLFFICELNERLAVVVALERHKHGSAMGIHADSLYWSP